jgi:hypothetical protein
MKKESICLVMVVLFILFGCAASRLKFINIHYLGSTVSHINQTILIADFMDKRKEIDADQKGYIGFRKLMGSHQETYHVYGQNLMRTLNYVTRKYLEDKGAKVLIGTLWTPGLDTIGQMAVDADQILTAEVNRFEVRAKKQAVTTQMTLDISMVFYLGRTDEDKAYLKKIPVSLVLERIEMGFSNEKLETFVSQSMTEVLEKALRFE